MKHYTTTDTNHQNLIKAINLFKTTVEYSHSLLPDIINYFKNLVGDIRVVDQNGDIYETQLSAYTVIKEASIQAVLKWTAENCDVMTVRLTLYPHSNLFEFNELELEYVPTQWGSPWKIVGDRCYLLTKYEPLDKSYTIREYKDYDTGVLTIQLDRTTEEEPTDYPWMRGVLKHLYII